MNLTTAERIRAAEHSLNEILEILEYADEYEVEGIEARVRDALIQLAMLEPEEWNEHDTDTTWDEFVDGE